MLRFSLFSKTGNLITEKSINVPFHSTNSQCLSVHSTYNNFKRSLGRIWGHPTYTVADNDILIKELIEWKNSNPVIAAEHGKAITEFVKTNGMVRNTTVFFEKHWMYKGLLWNLPMLYVDYTNYVYCEDLMVVLMIGAMLHMLVTLPVLFDKTVDIANARKNMKNTMDTNKIMNQNTKTSINETIVNDRIAAIEISRKNLKNIIETSKPNKPNKPNKQTKKDNPINMA